MQESMEQTGWTISETAERFGVEPSTLRYWEQEFGRWLKPGRDRRNQRVYGEDDLAMVRKIHDLMHVRLFTVEGAKRALAEWERTEGADPLARMEEKVDVLTRMVERLLAELSGQKATAEPANA